MHKKPINFGALKSQNMKKLFLLVVLFALQTAYSQTTIQFQYDAAGNQIFRGIVLSASKSSAPEEAVTAEEPTAITPQTTEELPQFVFYPNPVKEELQLQWTTPQAKDQPKTFRLYNTNGQQLVQESITPESQKHTLNFISYPSGVYNLQVEYIGGETKVVKVLKE